MSKIFKTILLLTFIVLAISKNAGFHDSDFDHEGFGQKDKKDNDVKNKKQDQNHENNFSENFSHLSPFPHSEKTKCCAAKPTLEVIGLGQVSVRADTVKVNLSITSQRPTANAAISDNAQKVNQIIKKIKALGIKEDQISTTNFSIYPHYIVNEDGSSSNEVDGFVVTQQIEIVVDNIDLAGKVIDCSVAKGALVDYVNFEVSNKLIKANRETLIGKAVDNAMKKAELTLKKLGYKITGIQSVVVNDNVNGGNIVYAKSDSTSTNLIGNTKTLSLTVDIVYTIFKKGDNYGKTN